VGNTEDFVSFRLESVEGRLSSLEVRVQAAEESRGAVKEWMRQQENRQQASDEKLDSIQKWLIGVMGSLTIALVLLLANLMISVNRITPR